MCVTWPDLSGLHLRSSPWLRWGAVRKTPRDCAAARISSKPGYSADVHKVGNHHEASGSNLRAPGEWIACRGVALWVWKPHSHTNLRLSHGGGSIPWMLTCSELQEISYKLLLQAAHRSLEVVGQPAMGWRCQTTCAILWEQ